MRRPPGVLAIDDRKQEQERIMTAANPSSFRTFTCTVKRRLTRALARGDNGEVSDILDAFQAYVLSHMG